MQVRTRIWAAIGASVLALMLAPGCDKGGKQSKAGGKATAQPTPAADPPATSGDAVPSGAKASSMATCHSQGKTWVINGGVESCGEARAYEVCCLERIGQMYPRLKDQVDAWIAERQGLSLHDCSRIANGGLRMHFHRMEWQCKSGEEEGPDEASTCYKYLDIPGPEYETTEAAQCPADQIASSPTGAATGGTTSTSTDTATDTAMGTDTATDTSTDEAIDQILNGDF